MQKSRLTWNNFTEHLQLTWRELYVEGRYADVTLVSDDQTQFKAHKIVLSACSQVFEKIIDNNPSQHPLIYLRGIQHEELESILQFIYLCETNIYQDRMAEFLRVLEDLGIEDIITRLETEESIKSDVELVEADNGPISPEGDVTLQEVEGLVLPLTSVSTEGADRQLKDREKEDRLEGLTCPDCGDVFTQTQSMKTHYRSKHQGVRYPCTECPYQATQQSSLKVHIRSRHEGVRYPCKDCQYQATEKRNLYKHVRKWHSSLTN